jgi:hypothetical protein
MGKKSDARAQRRALAQEKFEASKSSFLAKVDADHQPRLAVSLSDNDIPRLAPHLARALAVDAERQPKTAQDGSRFASRVTWCVNKADLSGSWSWGEDRKWSPEEWDNIIHPPLLEFSKLTWQEIDRFSSDTGHKMHHSHEVGDLIDEAQDRWRDLELEQYDSVFRFRMGGQKRRAWGFVVQAHFHFVWWDREHSIYPTEPS